jgi:hypothetical protein
LGLNQPIINQDPVMTNILLTRRTASLGIFLTIASISRLANAQANADVTQSGSEIPNTLSDLSTAWGEDGTRSSLADSLTEFFGNATGPYLDLSHDRSSNAKVQSNGEYLLADQLRLPLNGVAMPKQLLASGHFIYSAYINHNPMTRVFLLTDDKKKIVAAAFADNMVVKKEGETIGVVPRVILFYRTANAPEELAEVAVGQMKDYYKVFSPDTSRLGYEIHVFDHKLPPRSGTTL